MQNSSPSKTMRTVRVPKKVYKRLLKIQKNCARELLSHKENPTKRELSHAVPLHDLAAELMEIGINIADVLEQIYDKNINLSDPDAKDMVYAFSTQISRLAEILPKHYRLDELTAEPAKQLEIASAAQKVIEYLEDDDVIALQLYISNEAWGYMLQKKSTLRVRKYDKYVSVRVPDLVVHYISLALNL